MSCTAGCSVAAAIVVVVLLLLLVATRCLCVVLVPLVSITQLLIIVLIIVVVSTIDLLGVLERVRVVIAIVVLTSFVCNNEVAELILISAIVLGALFAAAHAVVITNVDVAIAGHLQLMRNNNVRSTRINNCSPKQKQAKSMPAKRWSNKRR